MAQSIKRLLHQDEDIGSDPSIHIKEEKKKGQGWQGSIRGKGDSHIPGAHWSS